MNMCFRAIKKGFTMIELIVVIAIIGVLAAILIPLMTGYVRQSQITSSDHIAASARKVISNTIAFLETTGCNIVCDETVIMYFEVENTDGSASAKFSHIGNWTFSDTNVSGFKQDNSNFTATDVENSLCKAMEEEILETRSGAIAAFIRNGICLQTVYSTIKDSVTSLTDVVTPETFSQSGCEQGIIDGVIIGTNPKVYVG